MFVVTLRPGQLMDLVFDAILYRKKAGLIYRVTRICSTKGTYFENSVCIQSFNHVANSNASLLERKKVFIKDKSSGHNIQAS